MLPGDGGQKSTFEKGLYHDSFLITSFFSRLPRYLSSLYDDIAGSGNPLQLEDFHKCQKSSIKIIFCKSGILYIPDIMKLCLALGLGRHVGGCTPYLSQDAPAYAWYALAYAYSHPQTACLSHLSPHLSHQGKHCHAYFYTTVYHRLCVICSYGQVTKSDVLDVLILLQLRVFSKQQLGREMTDSLASMQQRDNRKGRNAAAESRNQARILLQRKFKASPMLLPTILVAFLKIPLSYQDVVIDLSKAELDKETGNFCVIQKVRT